MVLAGGCTLKAKSGFIHGTAIKATSPFFVFVLGGFFWVSLFFVFVGSAKISCNSKTNVGTLLVLQTLFFGVKGAASLDRAVGCGVGCPDGMLSPWSWGKEGFVISWSAVINKW